MDSVPTACVNYTNTYILKAPMGQDVGATWDATISSTLNPISFGKARIIGIAGDTTLVDSITLLNTQLGGSGSEVDIFQACQTSWRTNVTKYRPMYMGITFTLTAPTLADQGTVASCQISLDVATLAYMGSDLQDGQNLIRLCEVMPDMDCQVTPLTPEFGFSAVQGQPGAFVSAAREGAYVVMKLDQEAMLYRSSMDTVIPATIVDANVNPNDASIAAVSLTDHPIHVCYPDGICAHQGLPHVAAASKDSKTPAVNATLVAGSAALRLSSKQMGITIFKGLSSSATVTVTTRIGFECVVPSDSILLPSVEKACSYDPIALNSYWSISKELLSTYPASYNFLGTLWSVVKNIGQQVLPHVGNFINAITGSTPAQPPPPPPPPQPRQVIREVVQAPPVREYVSMARDRKSVV